MERFALIADIHGNILALDAALADIDRRGIATIFDLGDTLCSPLWPAETADRLMEREIPSIMGNEDRILLEQDSSHNAHYTLAQIRREHLDWIARQPKTREPFADVLLCHGTPASDTEYLVEEVQPGGIRLRPLSELGRVPGLGWHSLIACGHSHLPRCIHVDAKRTIVNPGSVGLQAYKDEKPWAHEMESGSPHARYAIVSRAGGAWAVEQIAIPYDYAAASRRAAENGREDWAERLLTGRV